MPEPDEPRVFSSLERGFQALAIVVCASALIYFVAISLHWPLVWDETVIHTVNLLMAHGMVPYRDIFDINMPLMYLIDGWQMQLFGPGDFALRIYEFVILGLLVIAMIVVSGRRNWMAGLVAATVFIVIHGAEGPRNAAQRDEVMTILLMLGYASLFEGVRRKRPVLLMFAGAFVGSSIGIKPTVVPIAIALAILALNVLKRQREKTARYVLFATAGAAIPACTMLLFLLQHHALLAFLDLSTRLTPYYGSLGKRPLASLIFHALPMELAILSATAIGIALSGRKDADNWERWAILLAFAGAIFSFVIQGKGFAYQRYPSLCFGLLWACMELTKAMRKQGWKKWVGAAGLLYCLAWMVPHNAQAMESDDPEDAAFMNTLEQDLTKLGGNNLQGQVQCLDMVDGCLGALYHLGLVQNTGFTGDTLFFVHGHAPVPDYYRAVFWTDLQRTPPHVFVITNEWFGRTRGFEKLAEWPEFAAWLNAHYDLTQTRIFDDVAYRIYVAKQIR
jgi:hypothetical protein